MSATDKSDLKSLLTDDEINDTYIALKPIPVAALSMAWVCGRSLAGIVGSNPARGMDISLF
jgi:hypothetical protein